MMFLADVGVAQSQKKTDPFVVDPNANAADDDENAERSIGILVEFIKLDHLKANELLRIHAPKGADAQGLRDELEVLIKDGTAELLETTWIQARSGQRAKTESVNEVIYPTEWLPPMAFEKDGDTERNDSGIGSGDDLGSGAESDTLAPASETPPATSIDDTVAGLPSLIPSGFETRHVGVTLEVDPVLGADGRTIDLNLAPEIVYHLGDEFLAREGHEESAKGLEHVSNPSFYAMKVTTQVTTKDGKYAILSILTPQGGNDRVIVLLRADVIVVK